MNAAAGLDLNAASVPLTPYCGPSPLPAELWLRWNLDPVLLTGLAVLIVWHALHLRVFTRTGTAAQRTCFAAAWSLTAIAFVSPLCALGVALFSARVFQHMWLALVAAPLIALAHQWRALPRCGSKSLSPVVAAGLFCVALWAWHVPVIYDRTLENSFAYWLMHLSIGGTALMLWLAILDGARQRTLTQIGAGFITVVQMGLLGALIALAPRLLYRSHVATAPVWGLNPIEDQQLGGLLMWVPAGGVLLVAVLFLVYSALEPRGGQADRA